ncbi:hypothetical protein KUH03_36590 [Sphingobacterium sp. E70]|nr:hypothetical protein [Sphingobacterium sp. E70]ULT24444.1 hypothetical protein KUH03_36590 [Sphingobacterium sp. E70]
MASFSTSIGRMTLTKEPTRSRPCSFAARARTVRVRVFRDTSGSMA